MTTPDINRVRDLYTWTIAWRTDVPEGRDDLRRLQETQRAEFDAALAAHIDELRANIAQEVRDYWDANGDIIDTHNGARLAFDAIAARIESS
jgi:adenylate kinase